MRSTTRFFAALAISPMLLAGCATETSEPACLHLRDYNAAEQAAVADELDRLGPMSATGRFIADYGALRDQVRAACGRGFERKTSMTGRATV